MSEDIKNTTLKNSFVEAEDSTFFDRKEGAFFRKIDWWAFGICFLISFGVYFFTLAPTVTLEDSGELAVASDYLGVPHPPGYPIWTLLTWFFQWIFHWVGYNGHPNPAWGVALSSGFFSALACGILAMLISRSGSDMLSSIKRTTAAMGLRLESWLCLVCGVSGGLLFAFSPVLWSQSTIVEVYSLNAFFLMLVVLFLYMWMCRPQQMKWMYALAFSFGLGLTNHQSLMFMGLPLVVAVFLNEVQSPRDVMISAGILLLFIVGLLTPVPWVFLAIALAMTLLLRGMPLFRDFAILGLVMFAMFYTSGWMGKADLGLESGSRVYAEVRSWLDHLSWSQGGISKPGFWLWTGLAIFFPALVAMPKRFKSYFTLCILIPVTLFLLNEAGIIVDTAGNLAWNLDPSTAGFWIWTIAAIVMAAAVWRIPKKFVFHALGLVFVIAFLLSQKWAAEQGYATLMVAPDAETILNSKAYVGLSSPPSMATINMALAKVSHIPILLWFSIVVATVFFLFYEIPNGKGVGITFLLLELGVSFYLLMPFASEQNPPINWAYPRTWNGFMHAVTRGQYEKINPAVNFQKILAEPIYFLKQNFAIIFDPKGCISVVSQFTIYISLLTLVPFFSFSRISRKTRDWLIVSVVGFVSMTVIFIVFQFPKLDVQTLFIGRVQYIQAHAIFALWIGYGAMFAIAQIDTLLDGRREVAFTGLLVVLLFPLVPVLRNAYDQELLDLAGSSDQQGHDFGWQFGYYQLQGAKGILEELDPAERDEYPNPSYPQPMGTNAVFFGGTDPGRFVPTYMIYSAKVRPDVYLITQNALADATYLNVMRDLYGDDIWIPSTDDSNEAFRQYIDRIRSGELEAGADVNMENGRVSVQGVGGVMKINSILARMIFDANRFTQSPEIMAKFSGGESLDEMGVRVIEWEGVKRPVREFYVEESYVIPWMYPYLEPHGLIMKLNPVKTELTDEVVEKDRAFWEWYVEKLLSDKAFIRDVVARKTFSKLRSSIAGLYVARNRYDDGILAFEQAVRLYPLSPEANFKMADVLMRQDKFDRAKETMATMIERDPGNEKARDFLESIQRTDSMNKRRKLIESKMRNKQPLSPPELFELGQIYIAMQDQARFANLLRQVVADKKMPADIYLRFANLAGRLRRIDLFEQAIKKYTERKPRDPVGWINLALAQMARNAREQALSSLRRAVAVGGERARKMIAKDSRFQPFAKDPEFREFINPQSGGQRKPRKPLPQDLRKLLR